MFYALNLFDLKDEAVYRKYPQRLGQLCRNSAAISSSWGVELRKCP